MRLKAVYATEEEIPEGYADLYSERNGQWELTGVEGVRTPADVDRVQEALRKERKDHAVTKAALQPFEGLDPEAIAEQAVALENATAQLEAINKDGRIDEAKLEPIIAARIKQAVAPMEREKTNLERQLDAQRKLVNEREGEVVALKTTITTGNVERSIREAAATAKLVPTAVSDAVLQGSRVFEVTDEGRVITKDVPGVVPGLTPTEWLKDMQEKAPHWWPASVGGGSRGGNSNGPLGRANNPWSKEGWSITKQGQYIREFGEDKAKALAESVGSYVGATKPAAAA
jgi:hypothetical protein